MEFRTFCQKQKRILNARYSESFAFQHDEFRKQNRSYYEMLYSLESKKFKNESGIRATGNIKLESLIVLYWI